jgi:plasmid stabilization system protein ParE
MNVVFHVDALRELREAWDWYHGKGAPAKGLELIALVDEKIREVAASPESFPRVPKRSWARRARILKWPFALIFTVLDADRIVVLAVAHGKRRPGYWAKRRGARSG